MSITATERARLWREKYLKQFDCSPDPHCDVHHWHVAGGSCTCGPKRPSDDEMLAAYGAYVESEAIRAFFASLRQP
jgi:hypothetical protein